MANSGVPFIPGLANTALTAKTIVKVAGADNSFQPAGDNGIGVGIAVYDAAAGAQATVQTSGIADLIAGDTITRGTRIAADANSEGVAATAGENYIGIAMASAVDGDIFPILIQPGMVDSDT